MAKQLNVSLAFSADTSRAKAQLKDLQSQLNNLSNKTILKVDVDNSEIHSAVQDIAKLQAQIKSSTNQKTGLLDLGKFNESMAKSNMSLEKYQKTLSSLGSDGQKAFLSLTNSIINAETPLRRTNALLDEMKTTLANTARWQLSSSVLHGFMGAIQGAYGYAQDLNESLNNIRIVTGQSVEQMAKFAKEANTAAKALSTTTTEYTDAALIYYQQGLNDQEVKERTATTIKMANVSRQSAEIVSDQMTSVWNNFYDGSKSLEYYSDVMVKLGAATASSSEEIATGLEKFSAVSNTVGLSYEYAAAALATVTAQTRQSADTVGTAFRTLFTRLEGLSLGETAEDGTNLNKYSEALLKVGVNIKDQQGQLKDMDQILDELGSKWSTIGKEQQVALAQTVGGARQYATLIALMDNWDFFQENLSTAYGSSGALQEQADIYAESWEAARDRVTAAWEDIYDSLLKDDFFIGITDGLATVLNLIGDVVDGMGGFTGVLSLASTMAIKLFSKDIAKGLENFSYNLKSLTGLNKKENLESKLEAINLSGKMTIDSGTAEGSAWNAIMKNEALLNKAFIDNAENMNDEQKLQIQFEMDSLKVLKEQVVEKSKLLDLTEKENQELDKKLQRQSGVGSRKFAAEKATLIDANKKYLGQEDFLVSISKTGGKLSSENRKKLFDLAEEEDKGQNIDEKLLEELSQKASDKAHDNLLTAVSNFKEHTQLIDKNNEEIFEIIDLNTKYEQLYDDVEQTVTNIETHTKETSKNIENFGVKTYTVTEKMVAWTQVGMSAVTMLATMSGIIETLNDDSLTPWEKFTTILGTIVTTAPMLITTIGSAIPVIKGVTAATAKATITIGGASVAVNSLIWPISAVVIALTTLIGVWAWFETEHSFTGRLKKANEELERMQKAAANTSSSYETLKSSIQSLDSAKETLAGLTKGTEEWNSAVLELNQQVLDLIDTYPELARYMSTEDGVLSLSQEGIESVIASQREQAQAMQAAVLNQQRNILALENERIKKESESLSFEKIVQVDKGIDSVTGEQKYDTETRTISFSAESLASIGKQILAKDALNKDNTIDFSKIEPGLQQFESALNENIDTILSLATQFESLDNQLSAMDENLASSWLNSIGVDGEFNEFLSKGMAKSVDAYRSQTELAVNGASKDQVIEAYAQITGSSITAIEDAIANEKITLDDLKDTIITNSIHTQAFQEYENQLNSLNSLKGQAGYDTLKNIIASGGDESSYNALTKGQLIELKQLLFADPDGTLKSDIAKLFNENPEIFGEGFSEKLSSALTDDNYLENAQKERDKRHQAKLSDTAAALGIDDEALESFVNHLEASEEGLEDNKEAALEAAEAIIRYSRGAEKLAETFKDNEEALKETNKGTWEYYEALGEVQQAASEMFGLDLNTDYVEEHLDDLRKAAEGDETAIKNLQSTMATSWAKDFAAGVENGTNLLTEQAFNAEDWRNRFTSSVEAVNASLASMSDSFTLEEALAKGDQSVKNLIDTVNEAAAAGKMSAEEIDALFGSMGYSPEIKWEEVDGPATKWDATANILGFPITVSGETSNKIAVPQIADADKNGSISLTKISTSRSLSSNIKAGGNKTSGSQKDAKKASDEIERYHVIKEQMEDINNELDKISKAKDRAFGGDKLKLMDDEIAKTEALVEAQKEYLRQIESYYGADRAAIAAYGAQFDENGVITNYDALISAQIAKFNAARTDAAEEEFEKFKDVLEQYEETSDLVAEERQKLIDQENELADLLLEKLQYEIELKIEIEDDDLKYLDFLLKQVNDSAYEAADAIALLGQKTQSTFNKIDAYTEGINKLFQNHGFVGDITELLGDNSTDLLAIAEAYSFTEEEVETLRQYKDGLMESTEQLMDLQQEIRDKVIPAFEDLTAEMDEEIDKLNHLSTMLNHYGNIIDIIGKDTLGISDELMESLDVAKVNNAINQVESSYAKLNGMRQSRAEVEQQLEDARAEGNEGLISYWEEVLAELDVQIADATENMASSLEEALQQIADSYDAAVQRSIERFEKAMSGTYGNLEALQDAYDKQKEIDERYLEDYEQIYELNKLNRDISNSIDNTDNIKGKQMLIELQKEINDLEDAGVKLSEYDVNFLRQKYELRLAEIALEEAQNAKSQVRMTRDSEGNWSYTYTADQQNIADAQQNYEDVLFETQQLSTEYINNLQGQIIDAQVAMNQELAQLREDDEEGRQRVIDHYQGQIDYLTSQLQGALDNNKLIYEQDWQAYHDSTGYKISDQDEFLMNFENTNLSIMSGYDTLQGYQEAFTEASSLLYDELNEATADWQEATERAMQAAGTSVQTFAQDMDTAVNGSGGIVDQSNAAKESVVNMGQTMATTFGNVLTAVDNFETNYGHLINGVIADNNVLIASCNDIIRAWAQVDAAERRESFSTYNPQTKGTTDVSISGADGDPNDKSTTGSKKYVVTAQHAYGASDYFESESKAEAQAIYDQWYQFARQHPGFNGYPTKNFDTGGYTGAWGTTAGKLAMLHEKELVLNKDDTINFLKAINIVRELVGWLDTQAGLMSLPKLHASQLNYLSEGLEQNVIIDAHFPNATNKDEIKAAFHDLINRAAQYSNRKG